MSKNIKDIGKELMGKSLNSFHRKTGLTQLEKNNEMQDGILNGILSQVDDAYIEKIGQSNVIHLEGSGDGVVVLDSIEGNTMVNLHPTDLKIGSGDGQDSSTTWHVGVNMDKTRIKPNTYYTVFVLNSSGKVDRCYFNLCRNTVLTLNENKSSLFYTDDYEKSISYIHFYSTESVPKSEVINTKIAVLEGDYTNCNINFFEGLQSSFEEKVNDEGKYEIEILSNNKNLLNMKLKNSVNCTVSGANGDYTITPNNTTNNPCVNFDVFIPKGTYYYKGIGSQATQFRDINGVINYNLGSKNDRQVVFTKDIYGVSYNWGSNGTTNSFKFNTLNDIVSVKENEDVIPHKSNKIKVLLNSPLLKGDEIVCKEDGLYHYHKMGIDEINRDKNWRNYRETENILGFCYDIADAKKGSHTTYCDKLPTINSGISLQESSCILVGAGTGTCYVILSKNILTENTLEGFKQVIDKLSPKLVYELAEPYYEKITNEYGEPIILEGYENGTLYIDSVIVPTTTVRYTPKMESFKTLKEVKIRNTINDFDVTENVIPYMMEVDMKLTELEISAYSTYNIKNTRKMEVLDMTSMQERTFNMLERLIRGKSHTKQEMIDRVLLYEQAKRITTEQALELNLIIEEVYGA